MHKPANRFYHQRRNSTHAMKHVEIDDHSLSIINISHHHLLHFAFGSICLMLHHPSIISMNIVLLILYLLFLSVISQPSNLLRCNIFLGGIILLMLARKEKSKRMCAQNIFYIRCKYIQ